MKLRQTLEFGTDADNIRGYSDKIVAGFGSGGLGFVDTSGQIVARISLNSHPESFQIEEGGPRIFVNVPKESGVVVVDRTNRAIIAKWVLDWTLANYPMALDETDKRLFVGCRLPARLVVLNTDSGQVVAKLPIVGDTDDVYFDRTRRFVYAIGGEGAIDVFQMSDPNHYEYAGRTSSASGARTGLFVPAFDHLFVAAPHRGSQAARLLVYQIAQSAR